MKLKSYIDKVGTKALASKLKIDPSTVSLWKHSKSFPRPKRIIQLHVLSKGRVSFKEIIYHFARK